MFRTSSSWINASLGRSCHGLSHPLQGTRAAANGLTDIITRWSNVSSLSIVAKCSSGSARFPTHTKFQRAEVERTCGLYFKKWSYVFRYGHVFLFCCVKLTPEVRRSILDIYFTYIYIYKYICKYGGDQITG